MKKDRSRFIAVGIFLCCLELLVACHKSETVYPGDGRTVLVYMAADNSLSSYGYANIELMRKGMTNQAGRIVIYLDSKDKVPCLLSIEGGKHPKIDTLTVYPEENSASSSTLRRVIEDTRRLCPSVSYGLILWSHGMGWLPENYYFPGAYSAMRKERPYIPTKWFGQDVNTEDGSLESFIELENLPEGITGHFDFILLDACFMGAVEVVFELRDKADYFIVSPAEVLADGFPYDRITPYLWGGEKDLQQICIEYFNFYNSQADPGNMGWRSASVALVKASELEQLAAVVRDVVAGCDGTLAAGVWRYPLSMYSLPDVFYDLGDYLSVAEKVSGVSSWREQLNRTVIFKAVTPSLFGDEVPDGKYSGLSVYIPQSRWQSMNQEYEHLEWTKTVWE